MTYSKWGKVTYVLPDGSKKTCRARFEMLNVPFWTWVKVTLRPQKYRISGTIANNICEVEPDR